MQRIKDVYVKMMGRDKCDSQIIHLMNQMPGMETSGSQYDLRTHTSDGNNDDNN
jgi:hypothetical protein